MSEVAESSFGSATHRHVRNFLDSVKSRQQPVCNIEVGFHSTLPTLLAIVSVKEGRTVKWTARTPKPPRHELGILAGREAESSRSFFSHG